MHHTTETIAAQDTSIVPLLRRRYRRTCQIRRRESQRSMRPMAIVMLHENGEDVRQVAVVQNPQGSRHSERTVRTNRSATPFACGARNGVRITLMPSARNTASKLGVNFQSRSRIRKRTGFSCLASVHAT